MKILKYITLLLCTVSFSPTDNDGIDAYEVTQILPDINISGGIDRYDTSKAEVYYYKGLVIYKLNYTHSIIDDDIVKIKDEPGSHYILFKENEAYGYDFDEYRQPVKRKILIDSAFHGEWATDTDLYPMFTAYTTKLVNSRALGDSLIEQYSMWHKKDSKKVLDCELKYTTRLKNIEFSICKELDSVHNRKLYEMSFSGNPDYYKRFGITSGIYYCYYRLDKLKTFDSAYLLKLFNSYE